jgi:hypothetical protein
VADAVVRMMAWTPTHSSHDFNVWQSFRCPMIFPHLAEFKAPGSSRDPMVYSSVFPLLCHGWTFQACAAWLVASNVTGHAVWPMHLDIFWPHLDNQGAMLPGHGWGLLSALWPGGPNIGRVVHADHDEAKVLPPCKGTWHVAARLGRALPGTTQGTSPCREGCVAEKALSPGEGEKAYRRRLLPRAGRKVQSSEHGVTPLSHQKSMRGVQPSAVEDPCPAPGTHMVSTRQKPTAVGKQNTSLLVPGEVKTDKTGWSRPISMACQSA